MTRYVRLLAAAAALAVLPGCASSVRPRAAGLASAGASTARAASDSLLEARSAVDRYLEAQLLLAPLTGRPEPSEETVRSLATVRAALSARSEVVRALADSYSGLEALAAFDAAEQVETGVNGLAGAVSAYREALGEPPVPATSSFALGRAAGLFAGARQDARLKAASAEIRASLERVVELLRKERALHVSVRRALVEGQGAAARAFAALGLGRPGALLAPHAAAFGLAWDEKEYDGAAALLRKEPSITGRAGSTREDDLRAALDRVLEHRVARRAEAEGDLVEETIAGFEALAAAHRAFEAKEEADLAAVTAHVASLRALLEDYRAATGK